MFNNLRAQLVTTLILLLIVPLVTISALINHLSNKSIGESIVVSTSQTMDQYAAFVNTITRQVEDVANQVLSNELTQQWVDAQLRGNLTESERVVLNADLRKYLSSVALNNSAVASITIFDYYGNAVGIRDYVFHDMSYLESEWYQAFVQENRRWAKSHQDDYQPNYLKNVNLNSLIFPVVKLSNFKSVGVLKVNFLSSMLEKQLNLIDIGSGSQLFLLDAPGNPVIYTQAGETSDEFKEH